MNSTPLFPVNTYILKIILNYEDVALFIQIVNIQKKDFKNPLKDVSLSATSSMVDSFKML
jgi:hypothetical protein